MDEAPNGEFTIGPFDKALHHRSTFSCGFPPMDRFLKQGLTRQIAAGWINVFCAATDGGQVVGYYTLSSFDVAEENAAPLSGRSAPPTIPVTYVRGVAVDRTWQGRKIGTALIVDAMRRALRASEIVASAAVVLDVLRDDQFQRRWAFYERLGFQPLGDADNPERVFIGIRDVQATFCGTR